MNPLMVAKGRLEPMMQASKQVKDLADKVQIALVGNWETPFTKKIFQGGYDEELWLRLRALDNLSNTKVKIRVLSGGIHVAEFYLSETFTGDVPKGLSHTICAFARRHLWRSATVTNLTEDGETTTTLRLDGGAWLFKGTEHEIPLSIGHEYSVVIDVFHKNGPEKSSVFSIAVVDFGPATKVRSLTNVTKISGTPM